MSLLSFVGVAVVALLLFSMVFLFLFGLMHQHLVRNGTGFGRDAELHNKLDDLLFKEQKDA